jgi:hypothetical protein
MRDQKPDKSDKSGEAYSRSSQEGRQCKKKVAKYSRVKTQRIRGLIAKPQNLQLGSAKERYY